VSNCIPPSHPCCSFISDSGTICISATPGCGLWFMNSSRQENVPNLDMWVSSEKALAVEVLESDNVASVHCQTKPSDFCRVQLYDATGSAQIPALQRSNPREGDNYHGAGSASIFHGEDDYNRVVPATISEGGDGHITCNARLASGRRSNQISVRPAIIQGTYDYPAIRPAIISKRYDGSVTISGPYRYTGRTIRERADLALSRVARSGGGGYKGLTSRDPGDTGWDEIRPFRSLDIDLYGRPSNGYRTTMHQK
jgi:hypothetical protein